MFSGIVQASGTVSLIQKDSKNIRLRVRAPGSFGKPGIGSSVAVNGCCLTVVSNRKELAFDLLVETWKQTAFCKTRVGDRVNLERSLKANAELGGHFVLGHIDGTGIIQRVRTKRTDRGLTIRAPKSVSKYLVTKGSIAVDGVSLTVAGVSVNTFTVWIIPHTAQLTTLGWKRTGELVNLEADLIGKYVERFIRK